MAERRVRAMMEDILFDEKDSRKVVSEIELCGF